MKNVFALAVLLHLCSGYTVNVTLNREIIKKLDTLNEYSIGNKINITGPARIMVPKMPKIMTENATASCVRVFVRELTHLLNNVTVANQTSNDILPELRANLQALDPQQYAHKCQTTWKNKGLLPFKPFAEFLRKLNSRKR